MTSDKTSTATEENQTNAAVRRKSGEFVRAVIGARVQIGDAVLRPVLRPAYFQFPQCRWRCSRSCCASA